MLYWILIFLALRFLKAEDDILYAHVGGTIVLPIDLHGGTDVQNLYVHWFCGDTVCMTRHPYTSMPKRSDRFSLLSDFSLQISPVQETDFGVFRCEQQAFTKINIKTYRLLRVTVPQVQAMNAGDQLSLSCGLEGNPPAANVRWIPPRASDCNLKIKGNNIVIPTVPICASGVWTCDVKYNKLQYNATTTVHVLDLSPAPADSIYISALHTSTVNIPCSLSSDIPWTLLNESGLLGGIWSFTPPYDDKTPKQPPKSLLSLSINPTIQWNPTKDPYISVQGRELKDKDLSILNLPVSEKIRGEYTCSLSFKGKTFSRIVKVEFLQVSAQVPTGPLYEGQKVNLTCSVAQQNAIPKELELTWKCPSSCSNHPLLSSSPHPAFLPITVRAEDNGRWTCELWKNQMKLTSAWLTLKIEKVPVDIWLCVAVISGVVVFILLVVIIIIAIRRQKQMAMSRRRKTKYCCCKPAQQKGFYKT